MMIGIVLLALKATLVIACAFVVATIARRKRASLRHSIFAALFVALLALPFAPYLLPQATSLEVPVATSADDWSAGVLTRAEPGVAEPETMTDRRRLPMSVDLVAVAGSVYAAGVVLLLASLAAGVWRLRRWANHAEIWQDGTRLAADIACENAIRRAVLVVISGDVQVPLTFGFRRQTIVMPAAAREWTLEAVRRAIRHELEHVRRDDWALQLLARVSCAVWWPHPLVWLALRRFCLEAERACDDAVVNLSDASIYAEQLVTLARSLEHRVAVPALAMASRSRLSERVHAILDPRQPRGPQSRAALLTISGVMFALLVTFGSVQVVAAAAEMEEMIDDRDMYRDAIVEAAGRGDIETLEYFERRGVDLNEAIIGDGTPLLIAARDGRADAVRWLLDRGVDVNEPSPGDGNALIAAAGAGETGIMQMLLDRGARIEDVVPGDENALITAAAAGSDQAVKLLIDRGANVNARVWADDREWRTPLNMARRHGHHRIERMLINAGARQ